MIRRLWPKRTIIVLFSLVLACLLLFLFLGPGVNCLITTYEEQEAGYNLIRASSGVHFDDALILVGKFGIHVEFVGVEDPSAQNRIIHQLCRNRDRFTNKEVVVVFLEEGALPTNPPWGGVFPRVRPFLRGVVIRPNGKVRDVQGR